MACVSGNLGQLWLPADGMWGRIMELLRCVLRVLSLVLTFSPVVRGSRSPWETLALGKLRTLLLPLPDSHLRRLFASRDDSSLP
jgi:hypothetical protein